MIRHRRLREIHVSRQEVETETTAAQHESAFDQSLKEIGRLRDGVVEDGGEQDVVGALGNGVDQQVALAERDLRILLARPPDHFSDDVDPRVLGAGKTVSDERVEVTQPGPHIEYGTAVEVADFEQLEKPKT